MAIQPKNTRNPFPRTAVATVGTAKLPNYPSKSQERVIKSMQDFVLQFMAPNPLQGPQSKESSGASFGIRGTVGSGKTHTLLELQNRLQTILPSSKSIFTKSIETTSILDFYTRQFAGNLQLHDFRNLASLHLLKLLKARRPEEAERREKSLQTLLDVAVVEAETALRESGGQQRFLELVEADLIPSAELRQEFDSEILDSAKNLAEDLALAYSQVLNREYGDIAFRWLQGQTLSSQEMSDLGLRTSIATEADAIRASHFLLRAYRSADVLVMFSIDEFERFALQGECSLV